MIKEAIGVGESIEDAKESAILKLGLNATDDYDIEVLETPKNCGDDSNAQNVQKALRCK